MTYAVMINRREFLDNDGTPTGQIMETQQRMKIFESLEDAKGYEASESGLISKWVGLSQDGSGPWERA